MLNKKQENNERISKKKETYKRKRRYIANTRTGAATRVNDEGGVAGTMALARVVHDHLPDLQPQGIRSKTKVKHTKT